MTDHSKYSGPYRDIETAEVDLGKAFGAARELIVEVSKYGSIAPGYLMAISILACGAMIAGAICQLDATIRRRG